MTYPQPPYNQQPGYVPQPNFQAPPATYQAPPANYAQPGYPSPQYAQPQYQQPAPQPQQPMLARGSLEDWLDQPSMGGGTSVTKFFQGKPQGSWIQFQVSRDLTGADVRQQTDINGVPQTFKDGRPKFVLIIPVTVYGSSDGTHAAIFTEGGAGTLWLKGVTSDAFKQAMSAGGVISPDKALASGKIGGAIGTMQSAGEKPSNRPGFSATKLYHFTYQAGGRENQAATPDPTSPATAGSPVPAPTATAAPMPSAPPTDPAYQATQPSLQQYTQPAPTPVPSAPVAAAPAVPPNIPSPPPTAPTSAPAYQAAPPTAPPPPVPGMPQGSPGVAPPPPNGNAPVQYVLPDGTPVDAEKAALLARLQGQQQ